jgi:hypothetical protein
MLARVNKFFNKPKLWLLSICFVMGGFFTIKAQNSQDTYEVIKLEILCKTLKFILNQTHHPYPDTLNCSSLISLEATIPPAETQASFIFRIFKAKTYVSYGENRVDVRLNKLIKDINTELSKQFRDSEWKENVNALNVQLSETKKDLLTLIRDGAYRKDTAQSTKQSVSNPKAKSNTSDNLEDMAIFIFILIALLGGGIGYLIWQNRQLKNQIFELEDQFQEKYSRLDNRMDVFTPIRDYQALLLKFNFLNEQISALIQEVMVLKTRNEYKMSPQELVAKRTEHLEKYSYNPNVQIYYGKYRPDKMGFDGLEFKTEPSRDSIFKIEINLYNPDQASFSISDRSEYHQIALVNARLMLAPVCDYANEPYNDSRIITLESGLLEKKGNEWAVIKKAKIAFE